MIEEKHVDWTDIRHSCLLPLLNRYLSANLSISFPSVYSICVRRRLTVRSPQKQKTPPQKLEAKIPKRGNRRKSRKNRNDAIPARKGVGAVGLPPKTAPPLKNRLTAPVKRAADLLAPLKDATSSRAKKKTGSPRRPEKPSVIT